MLRAGTQSFSVTLASGLGVYIQIQVVTGSAETRSISSRKALHENKQQWGDNFINGQFIIVHLINFTNQFRYGNQNLALCIPPLHLLLQWKKLCQQCIRVLLPQFYVIVGKVKIYRYVMTAPIKNPFSQLQLHWTHDFHITGIWGHKCGLFALLFSTIRREAQGCNEPKRNAPFISLRFLLTLCLIRASSATRNSYKNTGQRHHKKAGTRCYYYQ